MVQRFYTLALNTFVETIRQPIYGVILLATAVLLVLNVSLAAFTLDDDDKLLIIDVQHPKDRYVRTALTRATANSIYGGTLAIRYRAENKPTTITAAGLAAAIVQGNFVADA